MGRLKKVILSVVFSVFALCLAGCATDGNLTESDLSNGPSPPQSSVENGEDSEDNSSSGNSSDLETGSSDWTPWVPID